MKNTLDNENTNYQGNEIIEWIKDWALSLDNTNYIDQYLAIILSSCLRQIIEDLKNYLYSTKKKKNSIICRKDMANLAIEALRLVADVFEKQKENNGQ
jgi:hypothetical protein